MFLFLIFPLANQIKTCVAINKLISLKFRYSTCLILSNGQFYIPKIPNIQIQSPKKENYGFPHLPFLVHLSVFSLCGFASFPPNGKSMFVPCPSRENLGHHHTLYELHYNLHLQQQPLSHGN
jgi:hypothetical protein